MASEDASSCTQCSAGNYCPTAQREIPCENGFYSEAGAEVCRPCPAGHECPTKTKASACSSGEYSTVGSSLCTPCPEGHYCPDTESDAPIPCPDGYYQSAKSSTSCEICPSGMECGDKTSTNGCPDGFYSHEGEMLCSACPDGYDCSTGDSITCSLGQYSENGECKDCPENYYCPSPSSKLVCPMGQTPKYPSGTTGASECEPCPDGYYCNGNQKTPCPKGYQCSKGSHQPELCPSGTYTSASQKSSCDMCPVGKCCPLKGTETPQNCPAGHFCPEGTANCHHFPCPIGKYRTGEGATAETDCQSCSAGKWCPEGSSEQLDCPSGFFCQFEEQNGFSKSCPAGTFTAEKGLSDAQQGAKCQDCGAGYYCPKGSENYPSTKKFPCPIGTFAKLTDTKLQSEDECTVCEAGNFCPKIAFVPTDWSAYKCRQGHYCPAGSSSSTEYPCPAGTRNDAIGGKSKADCKFCPAGTFCKEGTGVVGDDGLIPLNCNLGHFCPEGSINGDLHPCAPGTYGPATSLEKQDDCSKCPAGEYCTGGKSEPDALCPPGHFCLAETTRAKQHPCPEKYYQPYFGAADNSLCRDCPLGSFCEEGTAWPVMCPFGTYSNTIIGSKNDCVPCPAGSHCGTGTVTPEPCPKGTYSKPQSWECLPCLAGYFCPNEGMSYEDMLNSPCSGGINCEIGTIDQTESEDCPRGYVCPQNVDEPISCPPGTYQPLKGKDSLVNDCLPCKEGYYCQEASWYYNVNFECHPGYICPVGLDNPYKYEGATKGPQKIGSYGPKQIPCDAGTYNPKHGQFKEEHCLPCEEGFYCPQGSYEMVTCPLGYFCGPGAPVPVPCPVGTFGENLNLVSEEQCTDCTKGQFCNAVGLLQPRGPCDPGYVCETGTATSRPDSVCPAGSYCPSGTYDPWACPAGTFADQPGMIDMSDCSPCTEGSYCSEQNKPEVTDMCEAGCYCEGVTPGDFRGSYYKCQEPCTQGHFCVSGSSEPEKCPKGSYQPQDHQATCLVCPPGFYCSQEGLEVPKLCDAGKYCPAGTEEEFGFSCPSGTYSAQPGIYDEDQCIDCPRGRYCATVGSASNGEDCSAGFICTGGSSVSVPTENVGKQCPMGHFCLAGSTQEEKCPVGTYNSKEGSKSKDDCDACPATFYCPDAGLDDYALYVCDDGYICDLPGGNGALRPDPRDSSEGGQLCPSGSKCKAGVETMCPDGYFTEVNGATVCLICPDGVECKQGEDIAKCPLGLFCQGPSSQDDSALRYEECGTGTDSSASVAEGLFDFSQCTPCAAGQSCSQTDPSTPINAGFFSRSAAISSEPRTESLCNPFEDDLQEENQENPYEKARCGICPEGFYCETETVNPEPCAPGSIGSEIGGTDEGVCVDCPSRRYCPYLAMKSIDAANMTCADGYNCSTGGASNSRPKSNGCQPGNECTDGRSSPCAPGFYMPTSHASECIQVQMGFFQDEEGQSVQKPCPAGSYCAFVGNDLAADNLDKCETGTYFPDEGLTQIDTAQNCLYCEPGYYCNEIGMSQKPSELGNQCSEGYKCPAGNVAPNEDPCADGFYCPAGSWRELLCQAGNYCEAGIDKGSCDQGYYCPPGSSLPTEKDCPAGHFCAANSRSPTECDIGTYQPDLRQSSSTDCRSCQSGTFCDQESTHKPLDEIQRENLCSGGYFCPTGSFSEFGSTLSDEVAQICPKGHFCQSGTKLPCQSDSYQDEEGQSECKSCPDGYLCIGDQVTDPVICPEGSYCKNSVETKCPEGRYGNAQGLSTQDECPLCPAGFICASTGMTSSDLVDCEAGYYCHEGTANIGSQIDCPAGFYCESGVSYPTACPTGTYNPVSNSQNDQACMKCTAGYACPGVANTERLECEAGYYCPEGSLTTQEYLCPPGYYCPSGQDRGDEFPCPDTTWSDQPGLTTASDCQICPNGYLCDDDNGPLDDFAKLQPCNPNGTVDGNYGYCLSGAKETCPKGFYCPSETSFIYEPCKDGLYQPDAGQKECIKCESEYQCRFEINGNDDQTSVACPAGWTCLEGAVYDEIPCPPGTYQDDTTSDRSCLPCTAGFYCQSIGTALDDRESCDRGYYCGEGEKFSAPNKACDNNYVGDICSEGESCPSGSSDADDRTCENGEFAPIKGLDRCLECPAGFSCTDKADYPSDNSCNENQYCQRGKSPSNCPAGYYNPKLTGKSSKACQLCDPGYYCEEGQGPQPCTAGSYCPTGSAEQNAENCAYGICDDRSYFESICPPGFTCDGSESGNTCPDGSFCLTERDVLTDEAAANTVRLCGAGFYCNSSEPHPISCPIGYYNDQEGLSSPDGCMECNNGFYCDEIGQEELKNVCQDDFDCSTGANSQRDYTLCQPGFACVQGKPSECIDELKFQNYPGQSVCQSCPAGFICDTSSTSVSPGLCPEGQYCQENLPSQECDLGSYRSITSGTSASSCFKCEPGKYCPAPGMNQSPTDSCDAGYYCISSATEAKPAIESARICPAGNYCPIGVFAPVPCPVGTYRRELGGEELGDCTACTQGRKCDEEGRTQDGEICEPGFVCNGNKEPCPAGHYCSADRDDGSHKEPCPAGYWSDRQGLEELQDCYKCAEGYFCPDDGNLPYTAFSALKQCQPGNYCPEGSEEQVPCPVGFKCPVDLLPTPLECELNTYTANSGNTECTECEEGYSCSYAAAISFGAADLRAAQRGDCPLGYYCPGNFIR